MSTYEIVVSELDGSELLKRINDDGTESWIPKDVANSDYQEFLNKDKQKVISE